MRFNILSDADWESRIDQTLDALSNNGYRSYFEERDYGAGLIGVTVNFICQNPELNLKRRIRLDKKEKKLYMDIMLDLSEIKVMDARKRELVLAQQLSKEVPAVLSHYKIVDFNCSGFVNDLHDWFEKNTGVSIDGIHKGDSTL